MARRATFLTGVEALLQHHSFPLVILIGGVAAFAAFRQPAAPPAAMAEPVAPAPARPSQPGAANWAQAVPGDVDDVASAASPPAGSSISGEVVEQIDVAKYSYLRLRVPGGTETWTAVPSTSPRKGQTVVVANAEQMTNFNSASLKRTFDVIYFGVLGSDAPVAGQPAPHGLADGTPSPDAHDAEMAPHPGAGRDADAVPVAKTERAPGPLGRTVAELNALGAAAAGSKVRVRATAVKVTTGVLGRTFLHLRDGTGSAPLSHDLTATTSEEVSVGSQVLLEGSIEIDKDFGAGYRYPVLLADAHRVAP